MINNKEAYDLTMYESSLRKMNPESIRNLFESIMPRNEIDIHIKNTEDTVKKHIVILSSMTKQEKINPEIINDGRKLRISNGCGTNIEDIVVLLSNFKRMKKMYQKIHAKGKPTPPGSAAVMPIPEVPSFTKAIGRKYAS